MESSNMTEAVRYVLDEHSVFGEFIIGARYSVAVLAVLINAGIVIAFLLQKCRRPTAVQVSPTGLLVLNLVLADVIVGAVIFYNITVASTTMVAEPARCGVQLGISYLATIGSHVALLNVVVDRFIAITHTLHYRDMMTWRRSVFIMCFGWLIPLTGAVAVATASDNWSLETVRCYDRHASRMFLKYVWIPTHFTANLCVIVLQCRVYLTLRRHDAERASSTQVQKSADKSAWMLFRITMPTYLAMLILDAMRIVLMVHISQVTELLYQMTLLFVQIAFLMNPIFYSYATANIRKPVSELCDDVKRWFLGESTGSLVKAPLTSILSSEDFKNSCPSSFTSNAPKQSILFFVAK